MTKKMTNSKQFYITANCDILEDDYTTGEISNLNHFNINSIVKSETAIEAIEKFFEKELYFSFDKEFIRLDDDNQHVFYYSNLVNQENEEITGKECLKKWKSGKLKAYYCNSTVTIFELMKAKI